MIDMDKVMMDREGYTNWNYDSIAGKILSEIKSCPQEIMSPEALGPDDVPFWHEAGHATMALAFNCIFHAYNIGGKLAWVSRNAPASKAHYAVAEIKPREGVVSYQAAGLSTDDRRIVAAAGVASELVRFNHIRSFTMEQESDRRRGGYKNIYEIQDAAEDIATRFENDLNNLYRFVLNRMAHGQGFDDLNELIMAGKRVTDIFGEF